KGKGTLSVTSYAAKVGGSQSGGSSTGSSTDYTLAAIANPNPAILGQTVTITSSVAAAAAAPNVVVDVEIYDVGNVLVAQQIYSNQSFAAAGSSHSYIWNWLPTVPGQYTVKMGVFSPDWTTLYEWNNQAATVSVDTDPASPSTAGLTVIGTTATPSTIRRGQTLTVQTYVLSTTAASGIHIDLEIYNAAGAQVGQSVCNTDFAAGQTRRCTWQLKARLPSGPYTVKVGVFSPDWSTLY